jgi:hypothetical protein
MTIDIRSLAVGLILGISIAFSIAASSADKGTDGRFQIAVDADSIAYYVIDTRNGKVWSNKDEPKLK